VVLHGAREAGEARGLAHAVVRDTAVYGRELDADAHLMTAGADESAVDEVGHGDDGRDASPGEGARQAEHRGDVALRRERHEDNGGRRGAADGHVLGLCAHGHGPPPTFGKLAEQAADDGNGSVGLWDLKKARASRARFASFIIGPMWPLSL